jgi:hypothetical protein
MPQHPDHVIGWNGTMDELVQAVGNMRYDALGDFIYKLSQNIQEQSDADLKRGRPRLSKELYSASRKLIGADLYIGEAWEICKPYMKEP